jgi:hypothetical protein
MLPETKYGGQKEYCYLLGWLRGFMRLRFEFVCFKDKKGKEVVLVKVIF